MPPGSSKPGKSKKVAFIGLDAMDSKLIRMWIDELPTLKRLISVGQWSDLETTSDPLPGSVWPTFYTGENPSEHGIYHHLQWHPPSMHLKRVTPEWLYAAPFWHAFAARGIKTASLDTPMLMPRPGTPGLDVINWGSHDQLGPFDASQPDLKAIIRKQFGHHPMGAEIPVRKTRSQLQLIRDRLVAGAERKGCLASWFTETRDWDFINIVFGECHRGGHILWKDDTDADDAVPENSLKDVYRAVDAALSGLLKVLEKYDPAIVVYALHGMHGNVSQEHFTQALMDRVNGQTAADGPAEIASKPGLMRLLRENVPDQLQHAIAQAVPVFVRDWVVDKATTGGKDWSHLKGFPVLADLNAYIRLNLKQREVHGIMDPAGEQRTAYVARLKDIFYGLRDADTGRNLVKEVVETKPGDGRHADLMPDLMVVWAHEPPASRISIPGLGELTSHIATGRGGNHRSQGFCLTLNAGQQTPRPDHITDLAPLAKCLVENAA